ncbi:MAG: molecular chaperone HtpG [Marinilabiliales bacterium]
MQKGQIGVTSENIFPIIKKFLYSEQEIFLRELISNAIDATQKIKTLSRLGDYKEELGDLTIKVSVDKKKKTITVSDRGIGMTDKEVDKYINQIAFSSAEDFLKKYKDKTSIIGHFGLGFYSAFMVAEKVEIITKSYKRAKAVRWECNGSPEYILEEADKKDRGTDVILHIDKESKEYLEENKIEKLLNKYCKFLPVPIAFGEEKEWKDGKEVSTGKPKIINDTEPAWTKKPTELKDEDYKEFYRKLYPNVFEEPLFHIHLNVDYPFNLTGILYFPKIRNNFELQKNKIQLYCNQVFVTDTVEDIVPEFLTLLHGVIDSPDIPLNVSRSYLQGDPNVKKIASHITKKVADKLIEIFKQNRKEFEKKWDDLKIFIQYGMLTEEKFYDKIKDIYLLKNTEDKYFTFKEYSDIIKAEQTDKNKNLVYLYATDKIQQYAYIEKAKEKGYDVLLMDGQLDAHFINHLEQKMDKTTFTRVDADVVEKLIKKSDDDVKTNLSEDDQDDMRKIINTHLKDDVNYLIQFEGLGENEQPMIITQSEFMRRMKDMSKLGGGVSFYGDLPDSYNLVVNANHPLIKKVIDDKNKVLGEDLSRIRSELKTLREQIQEIDNKYKDKKTEEIPQADKDKKEDLEKKEKELNKSKEEKLVAYSKDNKLVKQLIDLALLANNLLKGEDLSAFVKRSVELIK